LSASNTQLSTAATSTKLMALPWRDTNHSPLSGKELRNIVVEATLREERNDEDDAFLDVPGVAWLEHINLIVGNKSEDRALAEAFYLDVMGMTPDKGKSFHVNLGRQQFHLATPTRDDEIPHRIHGSVGLAVPDTGTLRERLEAAKEDAEAANTLGFGDTLFDWYIERGDVDEEETIHVRCPWGNVFRCYSANARGPSPGLSSEEPAEESQQKMTTLHSPGIGLHGGDKMGVLSLGQPGIRYIELLCPEGVRAEQICMFYKEIVRTPAFVTSVKRKTQPELESCVVSVGPGIHLVFVETIPSSGEDDAAIEEDAFRMTKGIHVCIYAHDFHRLYQRLAARSLVWTNPRFVYLDTCDTWEKAKKSRTLRFRHIVDIDTDTDGADGDGDGDSDGTRCNTKSVLMELEHETRPMRHGQFMKVPYYVPK